LYILARSQENEGFNLNLQVVSLLPGLASLLTPWEVPDRDGEEARKFFSNNHLKISRDAYLFESSAIPATPMYHAKNAERSPNRPPAFCKPAIGTPPVTLGVKMYASASRRNVIQSQKNRRQKTTVERRVRSQKRNVIMNHP